MKLIDLLVKELPKLGGWPDGATPALVQNSSGHVYQAGGGDLLYFLRLADDWMNAEVTRAQYEAALAASSPRPGSLLQYGASGDEWDGVGLPPVGCECLTHAKPQGNEWCECKILAHTKFGGYDCAVFQTKETVSCSSAPHFRPIRSEADKKRKATIDMMDKRFKKILAAGSTEAMAIFATVYDTIAAGEIPGANIE